MLFAVYIDDLFALPLSASVICFADDTSVLYSAETEEEIEFQLTLDWEITSSTAK